MAYRREGGSVAYRRGKGVQKRLDCGFSGKWELLTQYRLQLMVYKLLSSTASRKRWNRQTGIVMFEKTV